MACLVVQSRLSFVRRCLLRSVAVIMAASLWQVPADGGSRQTQRSRRVAEISLTVVVEPAMIVNGSPFLVRVSSTQPLKSLKATWLDKHLSFYDGGNGLEWIGLSGVALDVAPGRYPLVVSGESVSGHKVTESQMVEVKRGLYRSSTLSVARQYTEPDPETARRIVEEQALKKKVFSEITPERRWLGNFLAPVNNVTTEPFGTQRTFNGKVQTVHQGLDFRAATGTPVHAMNSGTVLLARSLFFEGNCVVIDHGQGLLSLYLHLSQISVKEGDLVTKAQTLGLSGSTGRVTAPHLHVAVRWFGTYLDPARLLRLAIPD